MIYFLILNDSLFLWVFVTNEFYLHQKRNILSHWLIINSRIYIIGRYINLNPIIDKIDEILRNK